MAYDQIHKAASTSKTIPVLLRDSTTGQGKTGVAYSAVTARYLRDGASANVNVTLSAGTLGTYASGSWAEVDATNQPGLYQFAVPDTALAAGADGVTLTFRASGALDARIRIVLVTWDVRPSGGNLASDLQTIKAQSVTAAAAVTFPASVGTSTYAGTDTPGTTTLLGRVADILAPRPDRLTNLKLWLKGESDRYDATTGGNLLTANGGAVARWGDQSGYGNHATQATAANRMLVRGDKVVGEISSAQNATVVNQFFNLPSSVALDFQNFTAAFVVDLNVLRRGCTNQGGLQPLGFFLDLGGLGIAYQPSTGTLVFGGTGGTIATSTLRLPTSRALVVVVGTAGGLTVYVNDQSETLAPSPAGTSTGGRLFGYGTGPYPLQAAVSDAMLFDRGVMPAEVNDGLVPYAVGRGVVLSGTTERSVLVSGDSISASAGASLLRGWRQRAYVPPRTLQYNNSEPGITLATLYSESSTRDVPLVKAGVPNVAYVTACTNDLVFGATAASVKATLIAYCTALKAAGYRVIVVTPMPRTDINAISAQGETNRLAYIASVRADFGLGTVPTYADGLMDWAGDPAMGTYSSAYFADVAHPNDVGHPILAKYAPPFLAPAGYTISGGGPAAAGSASVPYVLTIAEGGEFRGQMSVRLSAGTGATINVTSSGTVSNNGTGTVTVTPAAGTTRLSFTVTRSTAGRSTVRITNGQGWGDATPVLYATSDDATTIPPTAAGVQSAIDVVTAKTNLLGTSAVAAAGDAMSLNSTVVSALVTALQAGMIDDTDGQQLLAAIVAKINATDVNLAGLSVSAIVSGVLQSLLSGQTTTGSVGKFLADLASGAAVVRASSGSGAAIPSAADNAAAVQTAIERAGGLLAETYALSADGGVSVLPLSLAAVAETYAVNGVHKLALACLQGEAFDFRFTVTDATGQPANLNGRTLRFVVFDANLLETFQIDEGPSLTHLTANVIRVSGTASLTANKRPNDQWILWDLTGSKVLGRGNFTISGAVKGTP